MHAFYFIDVHVVILFKIHQNAINSTTCTDLIIPTIYPCMHTSLTSHLYFTLQFISTFAERLKFFSLYSAPSSSPPLPPPPPDLLRLRPAGR